MAVKGIGSKSSAASVSTTPKISDTSKAKATATRSTATKGPAPSETAYGTARATPTRKKGTAVGVARPTVDPSGTSWRSRAAPARSALAVESVRQAFRPRRCSR